MRLKINIKPNQILQLFPMTIYLDLIQSVLNLINTKMIGKSATLLLVAFVHHVFCALECVPELQELSFIPSIQNLNQDLCDYSSEVFDPFSQAITCLEEMQNKNELATPLLSILEGFEESCKLGEPNYPHQIEDISQMTMKYLTQEGVSGTGYQIYFDCSVDHLFGTGTIDNPFEDLRNFYSAFEDYFEGYLAQEETFELFLEPNPDCHYTTPPLTLDPYYFEQANLFSIAQWPEKLSQPPVIDCVGDCHNLQQVALLELKGLELNILGNDKYVPRSLYDYEKVLRLYNVTITGSSENDVFAEIDNYIEFIFVNLKIANSRFKGLLTNQNYHKYSSSPKILHNITISNSSIDYFLSEITYYSKGLNTELANITIENSVIGSKFIMQEFSQFKGFVTSETAQHFVSRIDVSVENFTVSNSKVTGEELIWISENDELKTRKTTTSIYAGKMLRWRKEMLYSSSSDNSDNGVYFLQDFGCGGLFRRLGGSSYIIKEEEPDFEDYFLLRNISISDSEFQGGFIYVNVTPAEPNISFFSVKSSSFGKPIIRVEQDFMALLNQINEFNLATLDKSFELDSAMRVRNMSVVGVSIQKTSLISFLDYNDRCLLDLNVKRVKVDKKSTFKTLLVIRTETSPFADRFPWVPKEPARLRIEDSTIDNHFELIDWDAGINSFSDGVIEVFVSNLEFNDFDLDWDSPFAPISLWFPAQWSPRIYIQDLRANNLRAFNEQRAIFYFNHFSVRGQEAHISNVSLESLSNVTLFDSSGVFSVFEISDSVFSHTNIVFETLGSHNVTFKNCTFAGSAENEYEKSMSAVISISSADWVTFENLKVIEFCQLGTMAFLFHIKSEVRILNMENIINEDCSEVMAALFAVESADKVYMKNTSLASLDPKMKYPCPRIIQLKRNDVFLLNNDLSIIGLTINDIILSSYLIEIDAAPFSNLLELKNVSISGLEADFQGVSKLIGLLSLVAVPSTHYKDTFSSFSIQIANLSLRNSQILNFNRCLQGFLFFDIPPFNAIHFSLENVLLSSFNTVCDFLTLDSTPFNSSITNTVIENSSLVSYSSLGMVVSATGCSNLNVTGVYLIGSNVTGLVELKGDCRTSFNGLISQMHFLNHSSYRHAAISYTPQQSKQYGTYKLGINKIFFDDSDKDSDPRTLEKGLFFFMNDYSMDEDKIPVNIEISDIQGAVRSSSFAQIKSHANISMDSLVFHPLTTDHRILTIESKSLVLRNILIESSFDLCYDSDLIVLFSFYTDIHNLTVKNMCLSFDSAVLVKGTPNSNSNWNNFYSVILKASSMRFSDIIGGEMVRIFSAGKESIFIEDIEFERIHAMRGLNLREVEFNFEDLPELRKLEIKHMNDQMVMRGGKIVNCMFLESVVVADSVNLLGKLLMEALVIESTQSLNALVYVNTDEGEVSNITFFNNTVIYGGAMNMRGVWDIQDISYNMDFNRYYKGIFPEFDGIPTIVYEGADFKIFYQPRQLYIDQCFWEGDNSTMKEVVECPLIGNSTTLFQGNKDIWDEESMHDNHKNFSYMFFTELFSKVETKCEIQSHNDLSLQENEPINMEYIPFLRFTNDYWLALFDNTGDNQLFLSSNNAFLNLEIEIFDEVYFSEHPIDETLVDIADLFEDELSVAYLRYENSLESIDHFSLYHDGAFPNMYMTLMIDNQEIRTEEFSVELIPCPDGYRVTVSGSCQPCFTNDFSISDLMQFEEQKKKAQPGSKDYKFGKCEVCPQGANCGNGLLELQAGHWRTSRRSFVFFECPISAACLAENINDPGFNYVFVPLDSQRGEPKNLNKNCKEGHIGAYCNACDTDGLTSQNGTRYLQSKMGTCIKCKSDWVGWVSLLASLIIFCVGLPTLTIMLEINELSGDNLANQSLAENENLPVKYSRSPSPIFKLLSEYLFLISFIFTIQENSSMITMVNHLYFDFESIPFLLESSDAVTTVQSSFRYLSNSISNSFISLSQQAQCIWSNYSEYQTFGTASERLLSMIFFVSALNISIPIIYYMIRCRSLGNVKDRVIGVFVGFYHYQAIFISVPLLQICLTFPIDSGDVVSIFEPYRAMDKYSWPQLSSLFTLIMFYIVIPTILVGGMVRSHRRNSLQKKEVRVKYGIMYIHSKSNYYFYEILRIYCKAVILLVINVPLMHILIKALLILVVYTVYATYVKFTMPFINPILNRMVKLTTYVFIVDLVIVIVEMEVANVIMSEFKFLSIIDSKILWFYLLVFGCLMLFFGVVNIVYFVLFIRYSIKAFLPHFRTNVEKLKSFKNKIQTEPLSISGWFVNEKEGQEITTNDSHSQEMELVVRIHSPETSEEAIDSDRENDNGENWNEEPVEVYVDLGDEWRGYEKKESGEKLKGEGREEKLDVDEMGQGFGGNEEGESERKEEEEESWEKKQEKERKAEMVGIASGREEGPQDIVTKTDEGRNEEIGFEEEHQKNVTKTKEDENGEIGFEKPKEPQEKVKDFDKKENKDGFTEEKQEENPNEKDPEKIGGDNEGNSQTE